MKRKTKNLITRFVTFLLITTMIMPQITFAEYINEDSKGSINMEDHLDDNIGIDKFQGQETWYSDKVEQEGMEETYVYVSQASTFSAIIPKTIILDGQMKQGSYEVGVKGNLGGEVAVYVIPEKSFYLSQLGKNDILATVTQEKQEFRYSDGVRDTQLFKTTGTIVANDMSAGSWNGQFNFMINLDLQEPFVIAVDQQGIDLNAVGTFVLGSEKTNLVNTLIESGNVASANEVTTVVNVDTDTFTNKATATFNLKGIADIGDKVAIFHFDETTSEWEYIDTCIVGDDFKVTTNFTSFSPVAFTVINEKHQHCYRPSQVINATCESSGKKIFSCACGDSYEETINALGHNYVSNKCTRCSNLLPGLYDANDKMIVSWNTLVNSYGLNISKNHSSEENSRYSSVSLYGIMDDHNWDTKATKFVVDDSVTSIGNYGLHYCSSLTTIILPKNLKTIGIGTFDNCYSLTSISIPDTVTSIGDSAFIDCTKLKNVKLPKNLKTINEYMFFRCSALTNITMPEKLTTINDFAFSSCTTLTTIKLPNTITTMGGNVFSDCKKLKTINIPTKITNIPSSTFENCYALNNITIPSNITAINGYAFQNCSSLTTISIPSSVTTIGDYAFDNCKNLATVYFYRTSKTNFGTYSFRKLSGTGVIKTTYYFKNATAASYLTTSHYSSSYGTKSTNYDW